MLSEIHMGFLKKGTKLFSILKFKCPHCQEGDLFLVKNSYKLSTLDKMPKSCPVCGTGFERETGFYYGAMMISHATTTVLAVIVHLIVHAFYGWEIAPNFISIVVVILGLFPLVFRSSRAIWIGFFVKYDPSFKRLPEGRP
ncbi:MAG: DUF983 domain-containing protein [Bacteroidia bacterium]